MRTKRSPILIVILTSLLQNAASAAEFFPISSIVIRPARMAHWLDEPAQYRGTVRRIPSRCAVRLAALRAGEKSPIQVSFFDSPNAEVGMALHLAEGGSVLNKTPHEYHFSFPPRVLADVGKRLFDHYSRPVTSLTLTEDAVTPPFRNWAKLFAMEGLKEGLAQIWVLEVPSAALPALALSKAFPNLETLVVEPTGVDDLISFLGGSFPKLRHLDLNISQLSALDLERLLAHPNFASITELTLRMMNFGDEGLEALAQSPGLARIEALALEVMSREASSNVATAKGLKKVLQSPHLKVKKLAIKSIWRLGSEALDELHAWRGLSELEFLELLDSQSDQGVARLLKDRNLPRLRELRLERTVYDDRLLEALVENTSLTSLESVVVDLHTDISRDAVSAISLAPHLENLLVGYDFRD